MNALDYITTFLGQELRDAITAVDSSILPKLTEIRLRKNNYLVLIFKNTPFFTDGSGELSEHPCSKSLKVTADDVERLFLRLCEYSVYANTENIRRGFFTLSNGARVGVCGTAVMQNGEISNVKEIASLNIRIPREARGCSMEVLNCLYVRHFPSVIVAGLPGAGKTTFLRDLAYQLSNGFNDRYRKVVLVDERAELAGKCENGYSLSIGANTDVLSSYPKPEGIEFATRCLSPDLIVCDEIGTIKEANAVCAGFSCGVRFALSVHCGSYEELLKKPILRVLLQSGEFSYIVLLDGYRYKPKILDAEAVFSEICRDDSHHDCLCGSGNSALSSFC